METWAQRAESWVETGCTVLGRCAAPWCSEHFAGRCFLLLFAFSWGLNPNFSPEFLSLVGLWSCRGWRVQQIHHHGRQWGRLGALGVHRLSWEKGREIGWSWFLFLQPLLWTTRLRKPEHFLREHHPRPVLRAQGSALQGSRDIPSGGGKNNPGSLSCFHAGSGSRVRDIFPFDSSLVEMVTPLSHIKNETL